MVKKFTVPCDFGGKKFPVTFYVGNASIGNHPIGFQSKWLAEERGGNVPQQLMDSLKRLKEIADENKVDFEELCAYVIDEINASNIGVKKKTKKIKHAPKKQTAKDHKKAETDNIQSNKERS